MKSMTGYGRGVARDGRLEIVVELASVNRRNLEVQVNGPREWMGLEALLGERLRGAAARGRVAVSVRATPQGAAEGLVWDEAVVGLSLKRFQQLADSVEVPFRPDNAFLLEFVKALRPSSLLPELADVEPVLLRALEEAVPPFVAMRLAEGLALQSDLSDRLEKLKGIVMQIEAQAEGLIEAYREKLLLRLKSAGLENLDLGDERVLKEIALYADRSDIAEEITRLQSHFIQFDESLHAAEPVGRKLDFLIQEINREFNTIGSKSTRIEISQAVIEAKNELERVREQVANVE